MYSLRIIVQPKQQKKTWAHCMEKIVHWNLKYIVIKWNIMYELIAERFIYSRGCYVNIRLWANKQLIKTSPHIMTSSNGNIFRVTGPLRGESIGHWRISLTKASEAELWYYVWSTPEQRLIKQSGRRRFVTLSRSLRRHCNEPLYYHTAWWAHKLR